MASDATTAERAGAAACALCGSRRAEPVFEKGGWRFVRCADCGLVSLDPLPTPAALAAHHEASYRDGTYATFAAADGVRAAIARRRLALVRPAAPAGPWLDVGASTGAFVAAARAAGLDAEGLEVSAEAVAQARARGLPVHQGAVEEFAPSRRYAVVTAFDLVEHLPDPVRFLAHLHAWLQLDGLVALTLPNIASPTARAMGRQWFYWVGPDHVHYFTPATIRRLLAAGGFADVDVRAFRKPLTLAYAVDAMAHLARPLAPAVRGLAAALPRRARDAVVALPLGEMLVVARPGRPR
jgi:SAM-dependent methyltransferase